MDYKEKLRLAKEALDSGSYDKKTIEYIFPELQESEDERIRKELIELVEEIRSTTYYGRCCYKEIPFKSILAWLEKQAEQKPIDTKNLETAISNMLKVYSHIILHRSLTQDELNETDVYAAENTKNLLCFLEQKPAWSEEDESMLQNILECLKNGWSKLPTDILKYESWLESLKERYSWKPSDEQIYWLKWATGRMPDTEKANEAEAVLEDLLEQLKKLREE